MSIEITLPDVDLSFDFLELKSYRSDLRVNPGGVYAFYAEEGVCLYVGKSKTLYDRLMSHRTSEFAPEIVYVDVRFVGNPSDRDIYETFAIQVFNPEYNRDKVYVKPASPRLITALEDAYMDLDHVHTLKQDTLSEVAHLESLLVPPGRRRNSNFDKDDTSLSGAFNGYIGEMADYNSDDLAETRQDLVLAERSLAEFNDEEIALKKRIESIYAKLIV